MPDNITDSGKQSKEDALSDIFGGAVGGTPNDDKPKHKNNINGKQSKDEALSDIFGGEIKKKDGTQDGGTPSKNISPLGSQSTSKYPDDGEQTLKISDVLSGKVKPKTSILKDKSVGIQNITDKYGKTKPFLGNGEKTSQIRNSLVGSIKESGSNINPDDILKLGDNYDVSSIVKARDYTVNSLESKLSTARQEGMRISNQRSFSGGGMDKSYISPGILRKNEDDKNYVTADLENKKGNVKRAFNEYAAGVIVDKYTKPLKGANDLGLAKASTDIMINGIGKDIKDALGVSYSNTGNNAYDQAATGYEAFIAKQRQDANDMIEYGLSNNDQNALEAAKKKAEDIDKYVELYKSLDDKFPDVQLDETVRYLSDIAKREGMNWGLGFSSSDVYKLAGIANKENPNFMAKMGKYVDVISESEKGIVPGPNSLIKSNLTAQLGRSLLNWTAEKSGQLNRLLGNEKGVKADESVVENLGKRYTSKEGGLEDKIVFDNNNKAYTRKKNEYYGALNLSSFGKIAANIIPGIVEWISTEGGIISGLGKTAETATAADKLLGLVGASYITGYENNRAIADNLIQDKSGWGEVKKQAFSHFTTLVNAGVFHMLGASPTKVMQESMAKGVATDVLKTLEDANWKQLSKEGVQKLILDKVYPRAVNIVQGLGHSVAEGAKIAGAGEVSNKIEQLTSYIIDPKKTNFGSIEDNVKNFTQQALVMSLLPAFGRIASKGFEMPYVAKDALVDAANHDGIYKSEINAKMDSGEYSKEQGNKMIAMIGTMRNSLGLASMERDNNGLPLSQKAANEWAVADFRKKAANRLKEVGFDIDEEVVKAETEEAQKRAKALEGWQSIDDSEVFKSIRPVEAGTEAPKSYLDIEQDKKYKVTIGGTEKEVSGSDLSKLLRSPDTHDGETQLTIAKARVAELEEAKNPLVNLDTLEEGKPRELKPEEITELSQLKSFIKKSENEKTTGEKAEISNPKNAETKTYPSEISKPIFSDFNSTIADKGGKLLPWGEEIKQRINDGEKVTIVTRSSDELGEENKGKNRERILKALGLTEDTKQNLVIEENVSAENKAKMAKDAGGVLIDNSNAVSDAAKEAGAEFHNAREFNNPKTENLKEGDVLSDGRVIRNIDTEKGLVNVVSEDGKVSQTIPLKEAESLIGKKGEDVPAQDAKKADYTNRVNKKLKAADEENDPIKKALLLHDALDKANRAGLDNVKDIEAALNKHLEDNGLKMELPEIGSKYKDTNTGVDASIAGVSTEDLVVTEILSPGVRKINDDGSTVIVKKPVVIVMNKGEFDKMNEENKAAGKTIEEDINSQQKQQSDGKDKKSSQETLPSQEKGQEGNDVNKPQGGSNETPPLPPIVDENVDESSSDPLEVSLQRDKLLKEVKDRFYKPSNGSRSKSDEETLNNAVSTLAREAIQNDKSINEHLKDKVKNWYDELFDRDGNRIKDANGNDKAKAFTDEEIVMMGIHDLQLTKDIRDYKVTSGSLFDDAELAKLENTQLKGQMVVGIAGETSGRSLRSLANFYRFNNEAGFEILRKAASSSDLFGTDIPLEKDKYEAFRKGLTTKQQAVADIVRNALVKAKSVYDKANEGWDKLPEDVAKIRKDEVDRQVKIAVDKAVADVKKQSLRDKSTGITDNKGRVKKNAALKIHDLLNSFADDIEKNNRLGGKLPEGTQTAGLSGGENFSKKVADAIRVIAKKIKELGGSIPDLIADEVESLKASGFDEKESLKAIKDELKKAGISDDILESKPKREELIKQIVEHSKNEGLKTISKESIKKGLVKDLYHTLGESGVPVDKIDERVASMLKEAGIETGTQDLNEAYLGRGKYQLEKLKDLNNGERNVSKEISEHEKLQYDITQLDKKIKEVNETGTLSLEKKEDKIQELNRQKGKKYYEFEEALRNKGLKLERGSKESKEAKTAVIESHNSDVEGLGNKITTMLNDNKFGDIPESTKNFLRDLKKKLTHTINAHTLDSQMDIINGKVSTAIGDFEREHFGVTKRANKGLTEIHTDLRNLGRDLRNNRQSSAENIRLSEYNKRIIRERDEWKRKKAAGEFDDTKLNVDIKKDALSYWLDMEKNKAKYEFHRSLKQAKEMNDPWYVKTLKGVRELSRNLLLSGLTGMQSKLAIAAIGRHMQVASRAIGRGVGKLFGGSSVRLVADANADWEGLKGTLVGKSEKQAVADAKITSDALYKSNDKLNEVQNKYKELLVKNKGDENATGVRQFQLKELSEAQAEYSKAALDHAVSEMYNTRITPSAWNGRLVILKTGITKEERESGMLGKKETFKDYMNVNYDEMSDNEAAKDFNNKVKNMPSALKKSVLGALFYSRMLIRTHGAWKDIPARAGLIKSYIRRLKEVQKEGKEDIGDLSVKNRLWNESVLIDEQDDKFQSHNIGVDAIRKGQSFLPKIIREGGNKGLADVVDVVTSSITPVLKVPANIYWVKMQYNYGLLIGTVHAATIIARARKADMPIREFFKSKISDEEKYMLQTSFGRGAFGAAAMIAGYALQRSGAMITGGSYPDPKKYHVPLADGTFVDLEYGDVVINGHLINHLVAKGLEHLPNLSAFFTGHDVGEFEERAGYKKTPSPFIKGIHEAAMKSTIEGLPLPIERGLNRYGESTLDIRNPWSYVGTITAVKDIEKVLGADKDKAKSYEMTNLEQIYDNAGLLMWVPTEIKAKERMLKEKQDAIPDAQLIRNEYPWLFNKKGGSSGGGATGGY